MPERYPAHIIPKIKSAVTRINKSTAIQFELTTRRSEKEKRSIILCFRKLEANEPLATITQPTKKQQLPQTEAFNLIITALPVARRSQNTVLEIIVAFYEVKGSDYVLRNIAYTNKHAKNNYRSYLLKALQNDYGLAMHEDEEASRQIIAQEAMKAQEIAQGEAAEQQRRKQQEENKKRAQGYIESLSEESRSDLQAEAMANMSDNIKEIVLKKGLGSKIMLNMAMENIALQRLAEINTGKPVQPTLELAA